MRDAVEHDLKKLDLGKIVIRSRNADQARKVMSYRMSVSILGLGTWKVTAHNHSAGPITGLSVDVAAIDMQGNETREGVERSREILERSGVLERDRRCDVWKPWTIGGPVERKNGLQSDGTDDPGGVSRCGCCAHGRRFPTGLAPDERAVALYVLPPNTSPVVRMTFLDETGSRWVRTNDEEPERINR